jgi:hypothetical protein
LNLRKATFYNDIYKEVKHGKTKWTTN